MDAAAAIAMSVAAYRTRLMFDKMRGQTAVPASGEKPKADHPSGAT